jgi:hypothetical protein
MNCEKSRELFLDYLGDELDKPKARELRGHLETCQGCKQEFALLTGVRATLRDAWPDEDVPQHLTFDIPPVRALGLAGWFGRLGLSRGMAAAVAGTACFVLCLASLALFKTRLEIGDGGFRIAFGETGSSQNLSSEPVPSAVQAGLTPEDVQAAIQQSVQRLQQDQDSRLREELQNLKLELEATRKSDMQRVASGFKYLEETQNLVWKEAAKNSTYLDTIAHNLFVKASATQQ